MLVSSRSSNASRSFLKGEAEKRWTELNELLLRKKVQPKYFSLCGNYDNFSLKISEPVPERALRTQGKPLIHRRAESMDNTNLKAVVRWKIDAVCILAAVFRKYEATPAFLAKLPSHSFGTKISSRAFGWHRGVMFFLRWIFSIDKVQNIARLETDTCIIINPVARKGQMRHIFFNFNFNHFLREWVNRVIPVYWACARLSGIWSFSNVHQTAILRRSSYYLCMLPKETVSQK